MSGDEAKYRMCFSNNRLLFASRFGIWYGCGDILTLLCGVFEGLVLHQGRAKLCSRTGHTLKRDFTSALDTLYYF